MKTNKKISANISKTIFHSNVDSTPFNNHFPKSDQPSLYILSSSDRKFLYMGVSNHLQGDVWLRKKQSIEGCAVSCIVDQLVYCEMFANIRGAAKRHQELYLASDEELRQFIYDMNPEWKDLYRFS